MLFKLEIELGNAAMMGPEDVAEALEELAKRLRAWAKTGSMVSLAIRDRNGNSVGDWSIRTRRGDHE